MEPSGRKPPTGLRAHLDVKLEQGWHYEDSRGVFVEDEGAEFSPADDLPAKTRILYVAPQLASADPSTLSADERNLARYIQIVFPKSTSRKDYYELVSEWPCVEEVRLPPDISLPNS